MRKNLKAGEGNFEGIVILAVILIILIVMPKDGRQAASVSPGSVFSSPSGETFYSGTASTAQSTAISVGSGNASYSYQPYEEYVTIDNYGSNPVDITGWQLRNGKDKRVFYQGGVLQRFSADIAILPKVVLGPSETAVVTTGKVGVQTPYLIPNVFKENACTGYLERLDDYAFTPALSQNCPWPSEEPGISGLPRECRDIIANVSYCETPVWETRDQNREPCDNCLNGKSVPSYCAAFIREHFSYQGCLANHSSDANFAGRTWRIFLGRGWEMWAEDYETIELFNSLGQLVDFENY